MPSKHAKKLACEIVVDQFGEQVGKVCQTLVFKGQHSLPDLGRVTELTPPQLRNCVLVLSQHNCVQAYRVEPDAENPRTRPQVLYVALVSRILQRLRFPRMLLHVKEELGPDAEAVLEGLIEHGRLSVGQLVERASARTEDEAERSAQSEGVKEAFKQLVQARYVEKAPQAEPVLPPASEGDTKKGTRINARARAAAAKASVVESEEARAVRLSAVSDFDRFRLPSSVLGLENGAPTAAETKALSRTKRKREAELAEQAAQAAKQKADEEELVWRVNYDEFTRRFRHEAMSEFVEERMGPTAGAAVRTMLTETRGQEQSVAEKASGPVSVEAIHTILRSSPAGSALPKSSIRTALEQLAEEGSAMVTKENELGGGTYAVDMAHVVAEMRERELESVVRNRFGQGACRIFRLLRMKRMLEQKQIGEMAMIPIKDTRQLLYTLLKGHYVSLQELAKTADHVASRTFYLWRVNIPQVSEHALDEMYHGASNLRNRLQHELAQEKELLSICDDMAAGNAAGEHGSHVTLTSAQRERLEQFRQVAAVLESSLLALEKMIMLFSDF